MADFLDFFLHASLIGTASETLAHSDRFWTKPIDFSFFLLFLLKIKPSIPAKDIKYQLGKWMNTELENPGINFEIFFFTYETYATTFVNDILWSGAMYLHDEILKCNGMMNKQKDWGMEGWTKVTK